MTPTPVATTSSTPAATTTATASLKSPELGPGPIVGIVIGAVAFACLAGAIMYMCGRQKTIKEVIRHSQRRPVPGTEAYQPASPGFSEANYPNMQKTGVNSLMSGRLSSKSPYGPGTGTETETCRSTSPPADERSAMMHQHQSTMNPGSFGPDYFPHGPGFSAHSTQISGTSPGYYDVSNADGIIRYPRLQCEVCTTRLKP